MQDIAYPYLVGPGRLEAPKGTGRGGRQGAPGQAQAVQVLSDRALGEPYLVRPADYVDDPGGRARRHGPAQRGRLLQPLAPGAGTTPVGPGHRGEAGQAVFGVGGEPAVNAGAAERPLRAIRAHPSARRQLPGQPARLGGAAPGTGRLLDHAETEQRQLLGPVVGDVGHKCLLIGSVAGPRHAQ